MLRVVFPLAAAAMLAGCTAVVSSDEPTQATSPSSSVSPEPSSAPEPDESPSQAPIGCESPAELEIQEVINNQVAAFGDGDFERAYGYASGAFRANVSLEGFIEIIDGSYGPLIGSSDLVFNDCFVTAENLLAVIDAKFIQQTNEVLGLRYLMLNTDQGWRVQGASNLELLGEGA
ncbi:MAG: DUF4864 domain-containing protein [Aquiluna sp.]